MIIPKYFLGAYLLQKRIGGGTGGGGSGGGDGFIFLGNADLPDVDKAVKNVLYIQKLDNGRTYIYLTTDNLDWIDLSTVGDKLQMWRFDYFDGSHDEITQSSYGLHAECVDGVTGSVLAYTFNTRGLRYKNVAQCEYAKPDSNDILGSSMFWGRLADGIFRKFYTPNVAVIDWEFSADDEIATKGYVNTATGNSPALKQLGEKVAEIQKQLPKKEVGAFENPNTYTGLYEAFADVDETTRFVFRWTSALNPPLSLTITNTKFTSGISKHFFVNGTIVDADGVVSSLNFDAFLNATAHYVYRFPALKTENIGLIKIDAVVGSFSTGELYKILCIYMNNGTERNVTISAEKI